LIVDDENEVSRLLEMRLKKEGFDVVTASEGQEALGRVRTERPDLIILDIMMPRVDGYRICSLLKFDDNFKDIPILILSGRVSEEDKQRGLAAGANDYMTTPFQSEDVARRVRELLKGG
jgi:DNA-binding response OmpR family regulator